MLLGIFWITKIFNLPNIDVSSNGSRQRVADAFDSMRTTLPTVTCFPLEVKAAYAHTCVCVAVFDYKINGPSKIVHNSYNKSFLIRLQNFPNAKKGNYITLEVRVIRSLVRGVYFLQLTLYFMLCHWTPTTIIYYLGQSPVVNMYKK